MKYLFPSVVAVLLAGCQGVPNQGEGGGEAAAKFPAVYVSDFGLDINELESGREAETETGPVRRRLASLRRSPEDPATKA